MMNKMECEAKALRIVEHLLNPAVDPEWLLKMLKYINRCHMEDVIEERGMIKVCGYALCKNPITHETKQQYRISIRNKKVYNVTKKKNFCSSTCFGASNYLLEQMLESPLWLRESEKIPEFRFFCNDTSKSTSSRNGEVMNIDIIERFSKGEESKAEAEETSKSVQNLVQYNFKNENGAETLEEIKSVTEENTDITNNKDQRSVLETDMSAEAKLSGHISDIVLETNKNIRTEKLDTDLQNGKDEKQISGLKGNSQIVSNRDEKCVIKPDGSGKEKYPGDGVDSNTNTNIRTEKLNSDVQNEKVEKQTTKNLKPLDSNTIEQKDKPVKSKQNVKKKEPKVKVHVNLAAKVEQSLHEWITEETVNFLFGDESIKQKAIEKIKYQDKYSTLCGKLNRLQFQDEQEDAETLDKPVLKPAPHFAALKEESEKLNLKVRAYYQGKTVVKEQESPVADEESTGSETFIPLTETYAPQTLRRKILLQQLDQVVPDLLRTLAANNEVYTRACVNYYTSVRCTVLKALVHTFSLSATNIVFKTPEWTLLGLVFIKILSILDPWLASLISTKQAHMYISMVLRAYKLDPNYLDLLITSYSSKVNLN